MRWFVMAGALVVGACAPVLKGPLDAPEQPAATATLGHGYGLLMPLLQSESSATLIFGVKHGSDALQALVRRISDAAANAQRSLAALLANPPALDSKADGLPLIEVSTRNLMTNQEAAGLLLAGAEFQRRMILAQQKACAYIAALANTLSEADPNAERSALLTTLSEQFAAFDAELRGMLTVSQTSSKLPPK